MQKHSTELAMPTLVLPTNAPFVTGPSQGEWTFADWESLPADENRYEIIDGVLYMTTAPHSFHQWITRRLERFVGIPAEDAGLAFSFAAPVGLIMAGCDPVQPDYVVVSTAKIDIFYNGRIYGVPDLIVEILSPSTRSYDERVKLVAYAIAGVPEYAIIDPMNRTLDLYRLDAPGRYRSPLVFRSSDLVSFTCLPGISFALSELFAGAPDTTL
jgi:Uma2 family endonuclease